ncbi:pentatricopeptide repeat-containing protein-like [Forsythia ovata]|uniref:Pentatricopeptide repeat-containing protein-like n=1 Tax=Forsythia ovata TaxID=205694 RepID=A0ABD1WH72_9LAMI
MAYVPPYKRHSKDGAGGPSSSPSPTPPLETVNPNFKRKRNFNSKYIADKGVRKSIVYAENARSKWFTIGLTEDTLLPIMTRLEPSLAIHGRAKDAIRIFHLMQKRGQNPNDFTFSCMLFACSHGGLVEEGARFSIA